MRRKLVLWVSLLLLAPACASRIKKMPVEGVDVVRSHRLLLEGDELLKEGKDHFALLKYLDASILNPYNELIFNKLAIAYARLLRFHQAQRAVNRSLRLNPDYAHGHNTRGIVYLAQSRPEKAVKSFKKAIGLGPRNALFYFNLGTAYLNKGDFRAGREAYRTAFRLDPGVLDMDSVIQVATEQTEPTPEKFFEMASFFAEIGDNDMALHYLSKALADGFRDLDRLKSEPALAGLREEMDFLNLVQSYGLRL